MYELEFTAAPPEGSEIFVDLDAIFFIDGENCKEHVKGFYAGNGIYKVRFLPRKPGRYFWSVTGVVDLSGSDICAPAGKGHHGIVNAVGTHFEYEDGTNFIPVGTTIYALAHQDQELIDITFKTLQVSPFNKVRHCLFPKHYDYNNNDPEFFPFEKDTKGKWDVNRPCYAFWEHFESVIFRLAKLNIQTDLILFHSYDCWGFSEMSMEENRSYLEYVLRRFAAIPDLWWSMANEFDLVFARDMEDWYAIEKFIAENDPYHHLLSNHNCFAFYDFTRPAITHCCIQTTQVESAAKFLKEYGKPVVYDECCYEGNLPKAWGNISGFEMANRFWIACVQGAYATHGETFLSDDDILWWSRGGRLKGESRDRIAWLRTILEELPGPLLPWEASHEPGLHEEEYEKLARRFGMLMMSMPESQQESALVKEGEFRGHCGDDVFIQYLARHCVGRMDWELPLHKDYRVEIIDMWEMTRKTVYARVNGQMTIRLPGKEGIAVLATAV